jgi:hypothetical protein
MNGSLMSNYLLLLWALASAAHVPQAHSSDGTPVVGRLPVATDGYGPLLQRRIVVVRHFKE